jgi:hypothetical protein
MTPLRTRADELRAVSELRAELRAEGLDRQPPGSWERCRGVPVNSRANPSAVFLVNEKGTHPCRHRKCTPNIISG